MTCNLAYPGRIDWLVRFAYLLTKIKFGLLPIGLVFLIIIVVVWFIRNRPASYVPKGNRQRTDRFDQFARN